MNQALCGQPWVRNTLCLRSSQSALETAPSSPAPVVPAANDAWAAGLVLFCVPPKPDKAYTIIACGPGETCDRTGSIARWY